LLIGRLKEESAKDYGFVFRRRKQKDSPSSLICWQANVARDRSLAIHYVKAAPPRGWLKDHVLLAKAEKPRATYLAWVHPAGDDRIMSTFIGRTP
jgi:hypothetical protein